MNFVKDVEHIECVDDDGHRYTVVVWQKFVQGQNYVNEDVQASPKPAGKSLTLDDGRDVNALDKEMQTFRIVDDETVIKRLPSDR